MNNLYYETSFMALLAWCFNIEHVNAQVWDSVSSGLGVNGLGFGNAFCVYNGELYVAGSFQTAGGILSPNIARWNGTRWDSVGAGIRGGAGEGAGVSALAIYNGELYAGGKFDSAGDIPAAGIARWNGTTWDSVGPGFTGGGFLYTTVTNLIVYQDALYTSGSFDHLGNGTPIRGIAMWDGSNWTAVTTSLSTAGPVMTVYNNVLYVSGGTGFYPTSDLNYGNLAYTWNGSVWDTITNAGLTLGWPGPYAMVVYNGSLYIAGAIEMVGADTANGFARWNSNSWSAAGPLVHEHSIENFLVDDSDLYLGGSYSSINNIQVKAIVKWDGANLDTLAQAGLGQDGTVCAVSAICKYNGNIYVTGSFSYAGTTTLNNIARLVTNDSLTAINAIDLTGKVSVSPVPANNQITIASDLLLNGDYSIELTDISGRRLISEMVKINGREIIDVSALNEGTYLVVINTTQGQCTKKVIILR